MSTPSTVWRNPVHFLAFGLGSGAFPKAPGTAGTLAGALIWWLLWLLPSMNLTVYLLVLVVSFVVGIWICGRTAHDIGVHDHGGIVWDEFVGLWIALILVPPGIMWMITAIVLFRFFDIIKPWPIGWLDRHVSGGTGIMVDDVIAGLMALACLQLAAQVIL